MTALRQSFLFAFLVAAENTAKKRFQKGGGAKDHNFHRKNLVSKKGCVSV